MLGIGSAAGALVAMSIALSGCTTTDSGMPAGGTAGGAVLAQGGAARDMTQGVTVVGHGTTSAVPDTVRARVGVEVEADDVSEAFRAAAQAADRVISALRESGVAQEDIRTQDVSVHATHTEPPRDRGRPQVTGYVVRNMVEVTIRDIDAVGELLGAVTEAGGDATRIQGLQFSVEDATAQRREAREAAFADARAKAEQYADLAGRELGQLVSVAEGGAGVPPPVPEAIGDLGGEAAPPIERGQQTVEVQVQATWELR